MWKWTKIDTGRMILTLGFAVVMLSIIHAAGEVVDLWACLCVLTGIAIGEFMFRICGFHR